MSIASPSRPVRTLVSLLATFAVLLAGVVVAAPASADPVLVPLGGVLRDAGGETVAGVEVSAYRWGGAGWDWVGLDVTDEEGEFALEDSVEEGEFTFLLAAAELPGYYEQFLGGGLELPEGPEAGKSVPVYLGFSHVELSLVEGLTVSGTLHGIESFTLAEVQAKLFRGWPSTDGEGLEGWQVAVAQPAADGSFQLSGLAPGAPYTIAVGGGGAGYQFLGGSSSILGAEWFLAEDGLGPFDFTLVEGALLAGTVFGPGHEAAADVELAVYEWDGDEAAWRFAMEDYTGGDGHFSFGAVMPGTYTIKLTATWSNVSAPTQWLGGSTSRPAGPQSPGALVLGPGDSGPGDVELGPGTVIPGHLELPEGSDPQSFQVELLEVWTWDGGDGERIDDFFPRDSFAVDEDGSFEVSGLEEGSRYTVLASGDQGSLYLGDVSDVHDAQWFTAEHEGELEIDFVDVTGVELAATLDGEPYEGGGKVVLYRWDEDGGWTPLPSVDLGAAGTARSIGLLPGVYTAEIHPFADSVYPQFLGGSPDLPGAPATPLDSSRMFEVSAGALAPVELPLVRSVSMTGAVVVPQGVDLQSVDVSLFSVHEDTWTCSPREELQPGEDGEFSFSGLVPGASYTLRFRGAGLAEQFLGGVQDCFDAVLVTASEGAGFGETSLVEGTSVSGAVLDLESGEPLAEPVDVELRRWHQSHEYWYTVQSVAPEDGEFSFSHVGPGTYSLFADTQDSWQYYAQYLGGGSREPSPSDPVASFTVAEEPVSRELELERYRSVSGTVVGAQDPEQLTVELVEVSVEGGRVTGWSPTEWTATPDQEGSFEVSGMVKDQDYSLMVSGPGVATSFYAAAGPSLDGYGADWWPGATDVQDKVLHLAEGKALSVTPVFPGGEPPFWLEVSLLRWSETADDWARVRTLSSAEVSGSFDFEGLPAGRYVVSFSPSGSVDYTDQLAGGLLRAPSSPGHPSVIELGPGASLVEHDIELVRAGWLELQLTGAAGRFHDVEIFQDGERVTGSGRQGNGSVRFTLLPGSYELEIVRELAVVHSVSELEVVSGQTTDLGQIDLSEPAVTLGSVTISGTPAVGHSLSALVAGLEPAGASLAFEWLRGGETISGATSSEYTVTPADVGSTLAVRVTASAPLRAPTTVTSAPSAVVPLVVPTVVLSASGTVQVFEGEPVWLTATVTLPGGLEAEGSVQLTVGGSDLGPVELEGGEAVVTLPADLPVGEHLVTATFLPDVAWVDTAVSNTIPVRVVEATPVLPELDPPLVSGTPAVGQVLTASVSTELPEHTELAFQWLRDGVEIEGAAASSYSVTISDVGAALAVRVTASLELAEPVSAQSAPSAVVPKAPSSLALSASASKQTQGASPVRLTVTVSLPAGATPGGTVTFRRGSVAVATVSTAGATATYPLPQDLAVGSHSFSASFTPTDPRVSASTSAVVSVSVSPAPALAATVKLSSSKAKQAFGVKKPAKLTAVVKVPGGSTAGKVVFKDGTKKLGTVKVSGGKASLTLKSTLAVGKHSFTAEFTPATTAVKASRSGKVRFTVSKASPKVTAKLASSSVRAGTKATLTVKVSATGVKKPTGKLTVLAGKKKLVTTSLKAKHRGVLKIKLPRLARGKHSIKVTFAGSKTLAKKSSKKVTLRVR